MADLTDSQIVYRTVLEVAGEAGWLAIQEARGGMSIWIPLDPGPEHWLSQAIGHELAQELCRRLTIFDADGRRSCNMTIYIPRRQTRLQELRAKIREEIYECLMKGMSVRSTALTVRVTERDVFTERKSLLSIGTPLPLLKPGAATRSMLSKRPEMLTLPAPAFTPVHGDDKRQLWNMRVAIVDDGLLKGHSTRRVSMAAEVSPSYVRIRRKILLASGKLKPGRIGCSMAEPSADHSADVGEMVPLLAR